jgi:hypothetical protein
MTDTLKRSFVKAVVWETISNAACCALAWGWFGDLRMCLAFTGVCFLLKVLLFIPHERVWQHINFGRQP